MKQKSNADNSRKGIIIALACVLLALIAVLVIILTVKPDDEKPDGDTGTVETADATYEVAGDTSFIPGENDKIIEAVDDLGYCVLTMRYYFNEEGTLYRVDHTAEYTDEIQAKTDYALIESMNDFSEHSMENNVIKTALTPEGIESNYPDATLDSIIEYVKSKNMSYEVVQ